MLTVLVGADSHAEAIGILRDRLPLEFAPERVEEILLDEITSSLRRLIDNGVLAEEDCGRGVVRVPPVYLAVDGSAEARRHALKFAREVFTPVDAPGGFARRCPASTTYAARRGLTRAGCPCHAFVLGVKFFPAEGPVGQWFAPGGAELC